MASTAAFNALLKVIEEPPDHVLFAMATTDPQKVLPTILSRVQRLDLRRVGAGEVAGRVRDLVAREGGTIDDVAVDLVVRAGDGSVRDTESVLEQVLSYGDGTVTGADVAAVLGHTTFEHTAATVDAVMRGDLAAAYVKVSDLLDEGTDLRQFTLDLVGHVRDLLVLVVAPDRPDLVDATEDRRDALVAQADGLDRGDLASALDDLAVALEQMRQGPARLALELALARIATRPGVPVGGGTTLADPAVPEATEAGQDHGVDAGGPADAPDEASRRVADAPPVDPDGEDAAVAADGQDAADDSDGEDAADDPDGEDERVEPDGETDPDEAVHPDGDEVAADRDDDDATDDDATDLDATDDDSDDVVTDDDAEPAAEGSPAREPDLASRASARAERVARDGLPAVPDDRPAGPEVTVELPPSTDESADLDRIRARWDAILELVRAESKRSHAIFEPAEVQQLRNGILVLGYGERYRSFHADNAGRTEFAEVLVASIDQATGVTVRLDVRVEGDGPRRPRPRPVDDGPDGGGATSSGTPAPTAPATAPPDPTPAAGPSAAGTPSPGPTAPVTADPARARPPAAEGRSDDPGPDVGAGAATPTPLADLDPGEAMDRAAAALVDRLGAREVDPDDY